MSDIEVQQSIEIDAPAAVVWEVISHPGRYAEWVSNTDAVSRVNPAGGGDHDEDAEAAEGMTYEERNKVLARWRETSSWRVVEVEPERRVVHEADDLPMAKHMRVTFALEPAEEGDGVTYTHSWELDSKLGPGAKAFIPMVKKDIEATLDNLKSLAEHEAGGGDDDG